jgi:hypothetical protein
VVWRRKVDEAGSSAGSREELTILVGSVPCRLSARDMRAGKHASVHHEEVKMWHAPNNKHGESVKQPRLFSAAGREIVGFGFSTGARACTAGPGSETREMMK